MAVIQKEKARLKRKSKKAKVAEVPTEDSDSDTDISMNLIEEISPTKKQKLEKYKESDIPDNEKSEEEKAYLKFIHADEDSDQPLNED
jgi:hypothetical protein